MLRINLNKDSYRFFTENEAWGIFRVVAFSEALGWSILISGVLINRFKLPGSSIVIPIAGRIHGTFFLIYFAVLLAIFGSIKWSKRKFLLAIIAGIPPFGSLFFEQWAAWNRKNQISKDYLSNITLIILKDTSTT